MTMRMTRAQVENLIESVVSAADYDLGKQLDPETAEEGEEAAEVFMGELVHAFCESMDQMGVAFDIEDEDEDEDKDEDEDEDEDED